jgi:hypothetical protein
VGAALPAATPKAPRPAGGENRKKGERDALVLDCLKAAGKALRPAEIKKATGWEGSIFGTLKRLVAQGFVVNDLKACTYRLPPKNSDGLFPHEGPYSEKF